MGHDDRASLRDGSDGDDQMEVWCGVSWENDSAAQNCEEYQSIGQPPDDNCYDYFMSLR